MDEEIVPELIQHKFSVENICYETEKNLYNKEHRENMIKELAKVKDKLSDKYSAEEVANSIIEELNK